MHGTTPPPQPQPQPDHVGTVYTAPAQAQPPAQQTSVPQLPIPPPESAPTMTAAALQQQPVVAHGDELAVEARVGRGIGQLLMLGAGVVFLILGGIAMSKTGFDITDFNGEQVNVAGFQHTALMAMIELIVGFVLVLSGARPAMQWDSMRILGAIGLAFGVVLIAEPPALQTALGAGAQTGWLFGGMGLVLLVAAIVYPMMVADRSTTVAS